jgi:hypothetical protein
LIKEGVWGGWLGSLRCPSCYPGEDFAMSHATGVRNVVIHPWAILTSTYFNTWPVRTVLRWCEENFENLESFSVEIGVNYLSKLRPGSVSSQRVRNLEEYMLKGIDTLSEVKREFHLGSDIQVWTWRASPDEKFQLAAEQRSVERMSGQMGIKFNRM